MKKNFILATIIAITFLMISSATYAEDKIKELQTPCSKPIFAMEHPQLYDKTGKELTAPPKPGDKVYDKNGKEIQPPPFIKREPKGPDLKLTEEQKEKAGLIRENSKRKMKPIRREIHELKNKIWEIRENEQYTEKEKQEKIKPLKEKIHKLYKQSNTIREEDMKQFETILTKEQKDKLEKFKETHKPKRIHDTRRKHGFPKDFNN